jgi:predicted CXXCH cytochrome family protein
LLLAGCSTRETRADGSQTGPKQVTLFFTSEVRGYLGPCGCAENMRGGISRAAYQVAQARAAKTGPVHLIDCGDALFGDLNIPEAAVPQQERKAKALVDSWKAMGLSLRTVGPLDDARGKAFHDAFALPEVSSGSLKVLDGVAVISAPSMAEALKLVSAAKNSGGQFVVAVIPLPYEQLLHEAIEAPGIGLVISAKSRDAFSSEESRIAGGKTKVAQVQSKGRSLLKVIVSLRGGEVEWLRGDGERDRELYALDQRIELLRVQVNEPGLGDELKRLRKAKLEEIMVRREELAATPIVVPKDKSSVSARFLPLESNFPKDPAVQAVEKDYDVDVGLINLAYAKEKGVSCPPATDEKPGFVGTAACTECHLEALAVWKTTKHANAYAALQTVGKENHLDCVSCHVTGWQQPQGVCRIDQTEGRRDIGCESCHGPGSAHAKKPSKANISRSPEAKVCAGCHDRDNSPTFDFETYVARVLGHGHGN